MNHAAPQSTVPAPTMHQPIFCTFGVRILIVSAVLSMAGCASYAQRYAQANEEGLKAAGFEKRLADTPDDERGTAYHVACRPLMTGPASEHSQ